MSLEGRRDKHHAGFTLLEMLIALSVLTILTLIGIPSFRNFTADQEIKNQAQSLYTSLLFARTEALKRNAQVYVFPNDGDWSDGWLVSTDAGTTSADCASTADETNVLQVHCGIANSSVQLAAGAPASVSFQPSGRAAAARFVLCSGDGRARSVLVELGGLPLIEQGGNCS